MEGASLFRKKFHRRGEKAGEKGGRLLREGALTMERDSCRVIVFCLFLLRD
jgi:hypothetical protein